MLRVRLQLNNLVIYTIDEDLTTAQVTGSGSTTDQYSLWKYDLTGTPAASFPVNTMPTKVLNTLGNSIPVPEDFDVGADGKIHVCNSATPRTLVAQRLNWWYSVRLVSV